MGAGPKVQLQYLKLVRPAAAVVFNIGRNNTDDYKIRHTVKSLI